MEVVADVPPPLPPKTKKPTENMVIANGTSISIAPQNGHEVSSFKIVNNRRHDEGDFAAPPQSLLVTVKRVAEQSDDVAGKGRIADVISGNESESPRKIITWGSTKKTEVCPDLYENVSNGGVNYLESRLNNIINKEKKRKTPKIEVRQEEHKTVVKISVKDTPTPEEEIIGEDPFKIKENVYENGFVSLNSNVVCMNDHGIYENADAMAEDGRCYENVSMGCYENVSPDNQVYANVDNNVGAFNRSSKKELITEANYGNLNGIDSKCDQVCNERDFQVSKSVIDKKTAPPAKSPAKREDEDDESYENVRTDFHIYANESHHRNSRKPDDAAEKYESKKTVQKPSVVEVFLQKPTATVKVEDADDNSSGDPFDSGTCSDVDSLPNLIQNKKGNVIVTIKTLTEDKTEEKKMEPGHRRAESLTSSGVGVDSEESDDEKSNISCDSLNSNDPYLQSNSEDHGYHTPNSEDKTGSPVDQIVYENVIETGSQDQDKTDIIQQVANVSQKIKNLRMESTGVYTAKPMTPVDFEDYENVYMFEPSKFYKKKPPPPPPPGLQTLTETTEDDGKKSLPVNLLRDIRNIRLSSTYPKGEKPENSGNSISNAILNFEAKNQQTSGNGNKQLMVEEKTYEERKSEVKSVKVNRICAMEVDTDRFYKFHLAENVRDAGADGNGNEEETFAGVKDYLCREKPAAITSAKGTIRGVKNRVKAGIATFLQMHENKSYKDRDAGKVVVYTTTMGIVRETYHKCLKVKQILRTLMVKFEERDVFMSSEAQEEIRERMKCNAILVPQVFVEGQHIGDAETIERLNEMGELRTILKPYKSADACSTCKVCGGYRLLPCSVCKGSKKSIHRNHFTAEFVALKCMNCDQVGLTKCHAC